MRLADGEGEAVSALLAIYEFLTGDTPARKTPPLERRGLPDQGLNQTEKDACNMSVAPLFAKAKAPSPTMNEAAQLAAWLARGETEVFAVITTLTPTLAALLTQRNEDNRPVVWKGRNRSVEAYADAMRRGEWLLNAEPLIVSRDGYLNDGQHRAYAVLECQLSVPVMIAFGVERDTRHTVDQGIIRTPGHILALSGEVNVNQLACALQMLWCLDQGISLNYRPSPAQLFDTLDRHPTIREALPAVMKLFAHYRLSGGYIAAAHYLCRRVDTSTADMFLGDMTTGLNIKSVNSPVARLRKQFEEHSAKRKRLLRDEQAALYIKGFNNFRRGRQGALVWRNAGPAAEAFPMAGA